MTKRVLVLGSNATRIEVQDGGTGSTGNYLNETVVPAMALIEAGYNLVLATPSVPKPHIDEPRILRCISVETRPPTRVPRVSGQMIRRWIRFARCSLVGTLVKWDNSPGPFLDTGTTEHFHYVDANSESTHRDHRAAH
jgi:hypothetical protein